MPTYTVTITDAQAAILDRVASRDGQSIEGLLAKQLDYYLSTVATDYLAGPDVTLTTTQQAELDLRLTRARRDYLSELASVKTVVSPIIPLDKEVVL